MTNVESICIMAEVLKEVGERESVNDWIRYMFVIHIKRSTWIKYKCVVTIHIYRSNQIK